MGEALGALFHTFGRAIGVVVIVGPPELSSDFLLEPFGTDSCLTAKDSASRRRTRVRYPVSLFSWSRASRAASTLA
jgi:hypothetical protein